MKYLDYFVFGLGQLVVLVLLFFVKKITTTHTILTDLDFSEKLT